MEGQETENNKLEENGIISNHHEKIKDLNESMINAVRNALSDNPSCCLIPLMKDYLYFSRAILEENCVHGGSSSPKTLESLGAFFDEFEKSISTESDCATGVQGQEPTSKLKIDYVEDDGNAKTSSTALPSEEPSNKKFTASPNSSPFANLDFDQSDAVQIVKEADAIYSTRCKIFEVLKESTVKYKGTGMLYLKKSEENRYYVFVRADNSQGKVILNIPLQKSLPIAMKGKDGIATVDFCQGENGINAIPIVIKTATWKDADKLFEKLKEFQNA